MRLAKKRSEAKVHKHKANTFMRLLVEQIKRNRLYREAIIKLREEVERLKKCIEEIK